jgi:hypothetical protein
MRYVPPDVARLWQTARVHMARHTRMCNSPVPLAPEPNRIVMDCKLETFLTRESIVCLSPEKAA